MHPSQGTWLLSAKQTREKQCVPELRALWEPECQSSRCKRLRQLQEREGILVTTCFLLSFSDGAAVFFWMIFSCSSLQTTNIPINTKFVSSTGCFCTGKHTKISLHKRFCSWRKTIVIPALGSFGNWAYMFLLQLISRAWRILCCSNSKIRNAAIGSFLHTTALSGRPCAIPIPFAFHVHKGL